jgi:hypothetical protein
MSENKLTIKQRIEVIFLKLNIYLQVRTLKGLLKRISKRMEKKNNIEKISEEYFKKYGWRDESKYGIANCRLCRHSTKDFSEDEIEYLNEVHKGQEMVKCELATNQINEKLDVPNGIVQFVVAVGRCVLWDKE